MAAGPAITVYRAGDCYLQDSDIGFGFTGANGAVGARPPPTTPRRDASRNGFPITARGANFLQARYWEVWSAIATQTPFGNACTRCTENADNGAGVSWSVTLQPRPVDHVLPLHHLLFSDWPRGSAANDSRRAHGPRGRPLAIVPVGSLGRAQRGGPGDRRGQRHTQTRQVDDPAKPLRLALRFRGTITSATFTVNSSRAPGRAPVQDPRRPFGIGSLLIGSRFRNRCLADVVVNNAGGTADAEDGDSALPSSATQCKRQAGGRKLRSRRTPLAGGACA